MVFNASKLSETVKIVTGLAPFTPSTTTPDYVSLKNYGGCTVIIAADNATTVTGSAITLLQADTVAGGNEKALAFTTYYANIDTAASSVMTATTAVSNTFTTTAVNAKNSLYTIDILTEDLDMDNGFDCIRAGTGDAVSTVVCVLYALWLPRYAPVYADNPIVD